MIEKYLGEIYSLPKVLTGLIKRRVFEFLFGQLLLDFNPMPFLSRFGGLMSEVERGYAD